MKQTIPPFKATGKVAVYQHSDFSPTTSLNVTIITKDRASIGEAMEKAAAWKLQTLGVPEEKLKTFGFEYTGTDELHAMEPRGVKRVHGESVEAFFDDCSHTPAKRATLIRQRRLLPIDWKDAQAIYVKPVAAKQEEAVAA